MADQHSRTKVRLARPADTKAMISVVNAAFAVEDFLEGTRTDHERMAEISKTGEFLVAERSGRIVGSVYIECRGERVISACSRLLPTSRGAESLVF